MIFNSKRQITLRTLGDEVLAKTAEPILNVDADIVRLAREMMDVPRMVDDSSTVENRTNVQEDIQAQWNRILNPQKEEIIPQNEVTVLEDEFNGIVNYNIAAKKRGKLPFPVRQMRIKARAFGQFFTAVKHTAARRDRRNFG